ncbi:hypothetical protein ACSSS7_004898 [Eimeria intestinalis]
MSHLHFGRVIPIAFRRFPPLLCHNLLGKKLRVPEDLEGQLNVLVVGFKASHYPDIDSWMPFANKLKKDIMGRQHQIQEPLVQVYRLIIRQRMGVLLRWWTDERLRLAVGDGSHDGSEEINHFWHQNSHQRIMEEEKEEEHVVPAGAEDDRDASSPGVRSPEAVRASRLAFVRSRTLVSFTSKSEFVEALQIADAQRVYVFVVNKEGRIAGCEQERHSLAKENNLREALHLPLGNTPLLPHASTVQTPGILLRQEGACFFHDPRN